MIINIIDNSDNYTILYNGKVLNYSVVYVK